MLTIGVVAEHNVERTQTNACLLVEVPDTIQLLNIVAQMELTLGLATVTHHVAHIQTKLVLVILQIIRVQQEMLVALILQEVLTVVQRRPRIVLM